MFPLSNVPSSLVTVWGIDAVLFQITVEPIVIVRGSGLKPAFVTVTSIVDGPGFGVGVSARVDTAVGVGVGFDGCVGVGVGASVGLASTICPESEGGGEGLGVDTLVLPNSDVTL